MPRCHLAQLDCSFASAMDLGDVQGNKRQGIDLQRTCCYRIFSLPRTDLLQPCQHRVPIFPLHHAFSASCSKSSTRSGTSSSPVASPPALFDCICCAICLSWASSAGLSWLMKSGSTSAMPASGRSFEVSTVRLDRHLVHLVTATATYSSFGTVRSPRRCWQRGMLGLSHGARVGMRSGQLSTSWRYGLA